MILQLTFISNIHCTETICLLVFLGVYAYVILKDGVKVNEEKLKSDLKAMVKKSIGGHAVPEMIQVLT